MNTSFSARKFHSSRCLATTLTKAIAMVDYNKCTHVNSTINQRKLDENTCEKRWENLHDQVVIIIVITNNKITLVPRNQRKIWKPIQCPPLPLYPQEFPGLFTASPLWHFKFPVWWGYRCFQEPPIEHYIR